MKTRIYAAPAVKGFQVNLIKKRPGRPALEPLLKVMGVGNTWHINSNLLNIEQFRQGLIDQLTFWLLARQHA